MEVKQILKILFLGGRVFILTLITILVTNMDASLIFNKINIITTILMVAFIIYILIDNRLANYVCSKYEGSINNKNLSTLILSLNVIFLILLLFVPIETIISVYLIKMTLSGFIRKIKGIHAFALTKKQMVEKKTTIDPNKIEEAKKYAKRNVLFIVSELLFVILAIIYGNILYTNLNINTNTFIKDILIIQTIVLIFNYYRKEYFEPEVKLANVTISNIEIK